MDSPDAPTRKKPLRWIWFVVPPSILIALSAVVFGPFLLQEMHLRRAEALGAKVYYDNFFLEESLLLNTVHRVPGFQNWGIKLQSIEIGPIRLTPEQYAQVLREIRQIDAPLIVDLFWSDRLLSDLAQLETTRVSHLDLKGWKLNEELFRQVGRIHLLEGLILIGCKFENRGLEALGNLKMLDYINLDGSTINDEGLAQLRGLKNLNSLSVRYTQVSDIAKEELRKALPGLNLSDD